MQLTTRTMKFISLILWLTYGVKGLPLPYVWIDFDYVHTNNDWNNNNNVRAQTAPDGTVSLDNTYPTSTTTNNNGVTVGVFICNNQISGNPWNTPNTAAFLPPLTYNEFTLEVVVKPTSNDVIPKGYIVGLEGLWDTTEGDAISYNAITGKASSQPNKFFAANYIQQGWHATDAYFTSTLNTDPIDITKFHHVVVSQDSTGLVSVYVNGKPYGTRYQAPGGAKSKLLEFPYIKICGDDYGNIGFDGHIRSFGFYTQSLTDLDAYDACKSSGAATDCDTLAPTKSPTPTPTSEECLLGQGYHVEGIPAIVSGDPHFTLFNGDKHDFQGRGFPNQQFYYMHPCKGESRSDMPFTLLGKHQKIRATSVTVLDYITLELYDSNDDEYLIWLGSTKNSWTQRGPTTSTLYDLNPTTTNLVSGATLNIGQRFKVYYTRSGSRIDLVLTIDDICELRLYMSGQYLQVQPPQCYKCYTCGLLGDFQRRRSIAIIKRLRTCSGGFFQYRAGWSRDIAEAFDVHGWTWEKSYLENNCKNNWNRRLYVDEEGEYFIEIDPQFIYVDPCDPTVQQTVIDKCAETRNALSNCCNIIGGEFCDNLQDNCEIDACAFIGTDTNLLASTINEIFTEPVNLVCRLPGVDIMFDPKNLIEAECVNLEWIEVATEEIGVNIIHPLKKLVATEEIGMFTNKKYSDKFRFLDFENEIYAKYDISDIKKYKLEWDLNPGTTAYFNSIEFELGDSNPFKKIFKDQVPFGEIGQEDIQINILSSSIPEIQGDDQIFCKACSSESIVKFGDTCWGILDKTDANRQCGCNSGKWTGEGIYYGGWERYQCNQCLCFGGGFAGFKRNGEAKGGLASSGLKLSIAVCSL